MARKLLVYDVISFDIFDTLLLRPFAKPSDLFMLVGIKLNIVNFMKIRISAEEDARAEHFIKYGNREITIEDIYELLERRLGIPKEVGIQAEYETELDLCFANPYMKRVFDLLITQGKTVIITSDMYYPEAMMRRLLLKCGYANYEKLFVSCDNKGSKANGILYDIVKDYVGKRSLIHIGDNLKSDIEAARGKGIDTEYYKSVHSCGNQYRADGMSILVGSAYWGIVNAHLHNGVKTYSPYYEYGFIYAGLYITGYCAFIHDYALEHGIQKILFLSRDGDIYHQIFNQMYQDVDNEYFYWSRVPAITVALHKNRNRFLLQYITHKATDIRPTKIQTLLDALQLSHFSSYLSQYNLSGGERLHPGNAKIVENLFIDHWQEVEAAFAEDLAALKAYVERAVGSYEKVAIVDVGWTGNVVLTIKELIEEMDDQTRQATCILAGVKSTNPTEAAPLLVTKQVIPYIFSYSFNRNLYDTHQGTNKQLNTFFFEMMTQSNSSTFRGIKNGNYCFDQPEVENYAKNNEIHRGISDFSKIYQNVFEKYPYMLNISGHDAYLPFRMLVQNLTFIKKYFADFAFGRGVLTTAEEFTSETVEQVMRAHDL